MGTANDYTHTEGEGKSVTYNSPIQSTKSDMIYRQAAIDALCEECSKECNNEPCELYPCGEAEAIERVPSAQPERKVGKWTEDNACEFCGFKPWYERDIHTLSYCPNCGADMRGEQYE